jgi:very-short-patch-repair endonuclease
MTLRLTVEVDHLARLNLAASQAGAQVVRSLQVRNDGEEDLRDVSIVVSADPPFAAPLELRVDSIRTGSTQYFGDLQLLAAVDFLARQTERVLGRLTVDVRCGAGTATKSSAIEVLAPTDWLGISVLPELLAAFARPNAAVIAPLLKDAANRLGEATGDPSLSGYQTRDPRRVARTVQALYETVQARGVTYANPPASFEATGQKVRTHEQVIDGGLGTCLDLTVLLAALAEAAGMHAFMVVVQGHAFPGIWLTDWHLAEVTLDDPLPIRKRVELGEAIVFDSSAIAQRVPFDAAIAEADRRIASSAEFRVAIDVTACRAAGVRPLPLDHVVAPGSGPSDAEVVPMTPRASTLPEDRFRFVGVDARSDTRPRDRLQRWKERLLDLTLRNRLLNFRESGKTVPFRGIEIVKLEDALMSGATLEVRPKPTLPDTAGAEAHQAFLRGAQDQRRLHALLAPAELDARLLELFRSSRSAIEESGAVLLYVAVGFLRWFEAPSSDEPRLAPLILVPVRLTRASTRGVWHLSAEDEEPRINVTLLQKLRADFGLDTAGLDIPPGDEAGLDVRRIVHDMRRLVLEQPRWEVVEEAHLGLFSFSKFLMWLDLEARSQTLLANPLVAHIVAGKGGSFPLAAPLVPEPEVERARQTVDVLAVVDADPSQLRAMLAAEDGSSFVLQGPPGTGKSQTITNLIAQLLSKNKTVLFVSEKMAALEVVQRRLTQVGLGPFCLELHSQQASRKAVVAQIGKAFEVAGAAPPSGWTAHAEELARARSVVNAHAERLASPTPFRLDGAPVGSAERMSTRAVLSSLFALDDTKRVQLPALDPTALNPAAVDKLEQCVSAAAIAVEDAGGTAAHPWRGVMNRTWTPAWEREVHAAVADFAGLTARLRTAAAAAGEALGARELAEAPDGVRCLVNMAECVTSSPEPQESLLAVAGASDRIARLDELVARGTDLDAKRNDLAERWRAGLFDLDLDQLAARYARFKLSFWLVAIFALWSARSLLRSVAVGRLADRAAIASDLELARAVSQSSRDLDGDADARAWLGAKWRGAHSDWKSLTALRAWVARFHAAAREAVARTGSPGSVVRATQLCCTAAAVSAPGSRMHETLSRLPAAWSAWSQSHKQLITLLELDESDALGSEPTLARYEEVAHAWQDGRERLRSWCPVAATLHQLESGGLAPIAGGLRSGDVSPTTALRTIRRSLREAWWDAKLAAEPELAEFRGMAHHEHIRSFRELDEKAVDYARREVVARLAARVPDIHGPGDELGLLRRQLKLQRGHQATRKLMATIPTTLRRIKPCMLMSPLSVAQYLDPALPPFDVVVFDEASQIPPWDAIGAIARGRQVVVVGDSRQLPPTSFFERAAGADEETFTDDESLEELESVLDEATASGFHQIALRWHYRSRHESLIAFSNHHYYENNLLTFPSADHSARLRGVELRRVDGFYDRGGSRTNRAEAQAVVAELLAILSAPEAQRRSVGVVTFSQAQQRLVQDLLDHELMTRPELQQLFGNSVLEPVFVKNLENVQGDERDVMLMSVGYSADRSGVVTMNFGPLNRVGGERRLNVAVTRAREKLIVFATLRAEQIALDRTRAVGPAHLRSFLRYAEQGIRALDAETAAPDQHTFESPFEEQVCGALMRAGYVVHTQVGCSGYRVDLGIVHPDQPGLYLCGIECDGATYHGSRNARERDRLRQQVLEGLGWRMLRVWSTDWWYDRREQERRLLREVEALRKTIPALMEAPRAQAAPSPPAAGPSIESILEAGPASASRPVDAPVWRVPTTRGGDKESFGDQVNRSRLARDLEAVVAAAGPLTRDTAFRAVATGWGFASVGSRVYEALELALQSLPTERRPVLRDEFLWPMSLDPVHWRVFRIPAPGESARPADEVAVEEVANAAAWVLERGISMSRDALIKATAQALGYERVASKIESRMAQGIDHFVRQGRAIGDGEKVRLPQ